MLHPQCGIWIWLCYQTEKQAATFLKFFSHLPVVTLCLEKQTGRGYGVRTCILLTYFLFRSLCSSAMASLCSVLTWPDGWKLSCKLLLLTVMIVIFHTPIVSSDLQVSECTKICLKCHKRMWITYNYKWCQINNVSGVQYLKANWQAPLIRVFTVRKSFWVSFNP